MQKLEKLFLQAGGIGALPHGGGIVASIAAAALFYVAWPYLGLLTAAMRLTVLAVVLLCIFLLALFFIVSVIGKRPYDLRWIVIDEVLGTWIALSPFLFRDALSQWSVLIACALFLLIDWTKPLWIGRIDRHPAAASVLLDDCAAGLLAALIAGFMLP